MYELICGQLDITLNELFAGEHIEAGRLAGQADQNLEAMLADYGRMKKRMKIIIAILAVWLALSLYYIVKTVPVLCLVGVVEGFGTQGDVVRDVGKYSKSYYIETCGGDLDSDLSIFPDAIHEHMQVLHYESSLSTGLFDTSGYIVLVYTLNEEDFENELIRLGSLNKEIESDNGETYINKVLYVEGMYSCPAYITIDGFDSTYEYALIDQAGNRIVCVYLSDVQTAEFPYTEYLKRDLSSYDLGDPFSSYTMYNHSFDGGQTYVEFDDREN